MKTIRNLISLTLFTAAGTLASGQTRDITLNFKPSQTQVAFTLGDMLHTVHGIFQLKSGYIRYAPATNSISGEIIVDARSGESGSGGRDSKMHKEILESARYAEITFRPDHVDGKVIPGEHSTVQVHGTFGIHGQEHEMNLPVQVEFAPDHWNLSAHFDVPYVQWGLRDPSTFILRVQKQVAIDLRSSGP